MSQNEGPATTVPTSCKRNRNEVTTPVGVTPNPDGRWVAQHARNLAIEGRLDNVGFLIRYRDAKFTSAFDEVLTTEDARVILTPIRAPKANAFAERFVRTVRNELLDLTLVTGRRHLVRLSPSTRPTTTPIGHIVGSLSKRLQDGTPNAPRSQST